MDIKQRIQSEIEFLRSRLELIPESIRIEEAKQVLSSLESMIKTETQDKKGLKINIMRLRSLLEQTTSSDQQLNEAKESRFELQRMLDTAYGLDIQKYQD
ncbi:hypothetical protein ACFLS8_02225 [Chloroflexota bacterium]